MHALISHGSFFFYKIIMITTKTDISSPIVTYINNIAYRLIILGYITE